MSGKSHTKIINHLIAFTSLHRLFCFKLTFLSEFVIKYLKTSSFLWIFLCRNSSLTKTTDSYSFLCCCWRKKLASQNGKLLLSMKTTPHQVTSRQKILFLRLLSVFLSLSSFSLFDLLRPLPQICKVSLTQNH